MATILLVDDDKAFVEATGALLESRGYKIICAHTGRDGFEAAKKQKPDLMVLDVMMTHDSEGFEVARQLHDDPETRDMPVILLTGIRRAKSLPFSFEPDEDWLPVKAVFDKPVKPEDLFSSVEKALRKR